MKSKRNISEASHIQKLYGNHIVPITSFTAPKNVVEVKNIDELAKIAIDNNKVILHLNHNDIQNYFVQLEEITFLYRVFISHPLQALRQGNTP